MRIESNDIAATASVASPTLTYSAVVDVEIVRRSPPAAARSPLAALRAPPAARLVVARARGHESSRFAAPTVIGILLNLN